MKPCLRCRGCATAAEKKSPQHYNTTEGRNPTSASRRQEASGVSASFHPNALHLDIDAPAPPGHSTASRHHTKARRRNPPNTMFDTDGPHRSAATIVIVVTFLCTAENYKNTTVFQAVFFCPVREGLMTLDRGPHPGSGRLGRAAIAEQTSEPSERANRPVESPPLEREPWCPAQGGGRCPEHG